ncbi:unnamed protein product [Dovyalis caffra]|uniref:Uncharacterized protein n=1 Tax=Dovyalis caffra TaxID=77055 RepID=A0AAV1STL7_9ROSI|nr:unnamed protein product [Dovyalis caffra]
MDAAASDNSTDPFSQSTENKEVAILHMILKGGHSINSCNCAGELALVDELSLEKEN